MIFETLEFLRLNLVDHIVAMGMAGGDPNPVQLANIANASLDVPDPNNIDETNRLTISLVNIQEEFTYKNTPAVRNSESRPVYANPPVFLNLFMLVSASHHDYSTALRMLTLVVTYFQGTKSFTYSSAPVDPSLTTTNGLNEFSEEFLQKFKVSLDLYSLTFEQLNHLWGALGGKQYPFALYKVRVVELDANLQKRGGGYINEIKTVYP